MISVLTPNASLDLFSMVTLWTVPLCVYIFWGNIKLFHLFHAIVLSVVAVKQLQLAFHLKNPLKVSLVISVNVRTTLVHT